MAYNKKIRLSCMSPACSKPGIAHNQHRHHVGHSVASRMLIANHYDWHSFDIIQTLQTEHFHGLSIVTGCETVIRQLISLFYVHITGNQLTDS